MVGNSGNKSNLDFKFVFGYDVPNIRVAIFIYMHCIHITPTKLCSELRDMVKTLKSFPHSHIGLSRDGQNQANVINGQPLSGSKWFELNACAANTNWIACILNTCQADKD